MLNGIAQRFLQGHVDRKNVILPPTVALKLVKNSVDELRRFLTRAGDGEVLFPLGLTRVHE